MSSSASTAVPLPIPLRELLEQLEFLSMIQRGQKPCMSSMTLVDGKSWAGAWHRMMQKENKDNTILCIERVVDRAFEALNTYGDTDFMRLIIPILARARDGIANLGVTYEKYPRMVAKINICVQNITLQLDRNKQYLNPL